MKKIFLAAVIIFTFSLTIFVSAQGLKGATGKLQEVGGTNGQNIGVTGSLSSAISTVIKAVLSVVGTIFLLLTIYAGILWMTAQGEEEKAKKARDIISMSIIGLIIILSAYAITYFVTSKLGNLQ